MINDHRREQNRRSWNAIVPVHNSHRRDQAAFFRNGGSTLFTEEQELLGPVRGTRLLHLMCNSGQDTLSWVLQGAEATGVDISDEAICLARALAAQSQIQATFERADVYDWLAGAVDKGREFDRIYTGYGVICWLPDLEAWARGIAAVLAPGGRFALVEFHPCSNMFSADWQWRHNYPANGADLLLDGVGDYVGASGPGLAPSGFAEGVTDFQNPEPCHLFRWGVGEVVSALAGAGLVLETLREYPFVNGEQPFERMRVDANRRAYPPTDVPSMPLMYGLAASKREDA